VSTFLSLRFHIVAMSSQQPLAQAERDLHPSAFNEKAVGMLDGGGAIHLRVLVESVSDGGDC
jgi:hypothetical protein